MCVHENESKQSALVKVRANDAVIVLRDALLCALIVLSVSVCCCCLSLSQLYHSIILGKLFERT